MPLWRERLVVGLLCICTALVVVATVQGTSLSKGVGLELKIF